jgi:hypothetical protein
VLISPMSLLVRLVVIRPQGRGSTLQIGGCQVPHVFRVGSTLKIIFNDRDPLIHVLDLLLIPILRGCCRSELSTFAAPCAAA